MTNATRTMELAARKHAAEEIRYRASPQARIDAEADRARRAKADARSGHLPTCGLLRCNCKK